MMRAKYSSICPMCHVYISKNHSNIELLPKPMKPRCTSDGKRSKDTGKLYHANGRPIAQTPKRAVHEYCYQRALEVINAD